MQKRTHLICIQTILIACAFAIAGCGFQTHAERKYLSGIMGSSPYIRITPSQFDSAWSRAKRFVVAYSLCPIKVMNDSVISTDRPGMLDGRYGYVVTARTDQGLIIIKVFCRSGYVPFCVSSESRNSDILIDYIKTGELPFPEMVSK